MTAQELAAQSLMTEDDAQMVLNAISGMAFFTPEHIIELSCNGFSAANIVDLLRHDPAYLITFLDIAKQQKLEPTFLEAWQDLADSIDNLYTVIASKHPILKFLLRIFSH